MEEDGIFKLAIIHTLVILKSSDLAYASVVQEPRDNMKPETYQCLKHAYMGSIDKQALYQALAQEQDPFLHKQILLLTQTAHHPVPWNTTIFTSLFRNGEPTERLHQTVMFFLLHTTVIVKTEFYFRTFFKPESHNVMHAWLLILKQSIFAVLTLLYNVDWNAELLFKLDETILELVHGDRVSVLREFMNTDLNIPVPMTAAEQNFDKIYTLSVDQFGSALWRLIHWMAEAVDLNVHTNENIIKAKSIWRELLTESFYRLLRCGICMVHMHQIVQELKSQILDESTQQRQLWFNIHNRVTSKKKEQFIRSGTPDAFYSESELEADADFMRQALLP